MGKFLRARLDEKNITNANNLKKIYHINLKYGKFIIYITLQDDATFVTFTEILLQIFENNNEETYWIAKGFYDYTTEIEKECQALVDSTYELLQKENSDLYK